MFWKNVCLFVSIIHKYFISGQSALHESCSYFNTSQFQAERANFQEKVRQQIVGRYEELNADITDLQVRKYSLQYELHQI